jgi:hypothetical protein
MPSHVLYQIPMATRPIRLLMGALCLLFVLAIFGWWTPKAIRLPRRLPSGPQGIIAAMFAALPIAIGLGPLFVLIALIRNPTVYVTDTGVTQESVFHNSPTSFAWEEVDRVNCWSGRSGRRVVRITVIAKDGRQIQFGNAGTPEFPALQELFQNQLGPTVVHGCQRGLPVGSH